MDILALLNKLVIFVLLMLIGYLGARRGLLPKEFTRAASKMVMNVFMVASILNSVIASPPSLSGGRLLVAVALNCGVMGLSYLAAALLTRLLRIRGEKAPLFELLIAVMNPMFIGLPVAQALYGSEGVLFVALNSIPFNLLIYTYGVWRLRSGEEGGVNWRDMLSPPMIGTLAAVLILLLRIPMPAVVKDFVGTLSGATLPVSMIVIGSSLGGVRLLDAFQEKSLYLVAALRLLALPLLTWALMLPLPVEDAMRGTALIIAACPSGVIVSILGLQYGKDAVYLSKGILLNTTLSMLTIPLLAALLL